MIDGVSLLRSLRQQLDEPSGGSWLDNRTSYEYLWEAAVRLNDLTGILTTTQSINTVASQASYTLNADFLRLWLKNQDNEYYIKYNDGSTNTFIEFKDYEDIIYEDQTTSVVVPDHFGLLDDRTLDSQITGSCTNAGALTAGQATLTASTSDFSDVSAGDHVHNTTDGSTGYVLSKTSSTVLVTALFDGTDNDWDASDVFVIQPQGRMQLYLAPPPSTSSHVMTVEYVQRPAPVMSNYGIYRFPSHFISFLVDYAAARYKYRDRDREYGREFFALWDAEVRRAVGMSRKARRRGDWGVNMRRRHR